jgi:hypothetical protein
MLLEHGMGVDPGEAERIDPGATGILSIAVDPRASRGQELQSAIGKPLGRAIRTQGRRKDPMMQRQGRLDQTGHSGGGHGMTDLGRDGAQDTRLTVRRGKHMLQRAKLGSIGRRHA